MSYFVKAKEELPVIWGNFSFPIHVFGILSDYFITLLVMMDAGSKKFCYLLILIRDAAKVDILKHG